MEKVMGVNPTLKMGVSFAAGLVLAGTGAYAVTSLNSNQVGACVSKTTRVMTLAPSTGTCPKGSTLVLWNKIGPRGLTGPQARRVPQAQPPIQLAQPDFPSKRLRPNCYPPSS
jgi:hypothetical protein